MDPKTNTALNTPANGATHPVRHGDDPRELNAHAWQYMEVDAALALQFALRAKEHAAAQHDRSALAGALSAIGRAYFYLSERESAQVNAEEALILFGESGDDAGCAQAMLTIALAVNDEPERVLDICEQALEYAGNAADLILQSAALRTIGDAYKSLGDAAAAEAAFNRALTLARESHDSGAISLSLQRIGLLQFHGGLYDQAQLTFAEALDFAVDSGSPRTRAFCQHYLGLVEINRSQYASALIYFTAALDLYRSIGNKIWQAQALHNIGNIHEQLGDYHSALQFWKQAVTVQDSAGDLKGMATSLQGIGSAYLALNDTQNALTNFNYSLQLSRDAGYLLGQGEALRWIGEAHLKTNDLPQAIDHFHQSVATHRHLGRREVELAALQNLGEAYHKSGDLLKANEYYQQCLALATDINAPYNQAWILIRMGTLVSEQGHQPRAQTLLGQALQIATDARMKELVYQAHKALASVCELQKDYQQALEHYRQYNAVREEVFNDASDQRMRNLAVQYQVEKKDREAEISRLKNVELVRLNDELREANRLKNEFLRIAAHDLKNPLAGVRMMTELTLQGLAQDSPAAQTQKMVYDSSDRMLEIVNRLLDIARLESGTIEIVKEHVDIAEIVREVIEQNQGAAEAKSQQIEAVFEANCLVNGDKGWLRESVDNLVSNAVKYTAPGKGIRVEVSLSVMDVRVVVRDEGQGLSPEDLKLLFKPFQRLSPQPTGGESSTGLGLSIVRQLVELHGGSVDAESRQGHGSAFTIRLPRA